MCSNQSTSSMRSDYCIYTDKCPESDRCVPCLYKNRTGSLKPQLIKVNPDGSFYAQNRLGGYVKNCSCTSEKLCNPFYDVMKHYEFPPEVNFLPYESNINFAKF